MSADGIKNMVIRYCVIQVNRDDALQRYNNNPFSNDDKSDSYYNVANNSVCAYTDICYNDSTYSTSYISYDNQGIKPDGLYYDPYYDSYEQSQLSNIFYYVLVLMSVVGSISIMCCIYSPGRFCCKSTYRESFSEEKVKTERRQYWNFFWLVVIIHWTSIAIFIGIEVATRNDGRLRTVITEEVSFMSNVSVAMNFIWNLTRGISLYPICFSWIEGYKIQYKDRDTKTRNKVQVAVLIFLLMFELTMIEVLSSHWNSPLANFILVIAIVVPAFFLFLYFFVTSEQKKTTQFYINKSQQQRERLLNPLEQNQYLIKPENLTIFERIGAGGCGMIYKATIGANTVVAAKEIITAMMDPKDIKEFEHEAKMLTQMNHPYVLRVFGFCTKTAEQSSDDMEHRYIVTEFAPNGSLEKAIQDAIAVKKMIKETGSNMIKMPFTKLQALEWAIQIASGMAFVHERGTPFLFPTSNK